MRNERKNKAPEPQCFYKLVDTHIAAKFTQARSLKESASFSLLCRLPPSLRAGWLAAKSLSHIACKPCQARAMCKCDFARHIAVAGCELPESCQTMLNTHRLRLPSLLHATNLVKNQLVAILVQGRRLPDYERRRPLTTTHQHTQGIPRFANGNSP